MPLQVGMGQGPGLLALRCVFFNRRVGGKGANVLCKAARVAGVALGYRQAFKLVAFKQRRPSAALQRGGQFPAQVHRVFHRRVVPQPTGGGKQMRRVTSKQHAALLHALRGKCVARNPGAGGQNLHFHGRAKHLGHQLAGLCLAPVRGVFVVVQRRVHGKFVVAID